MQAVPTARRDVAFSSLLVILASVAFALGSSPHPFGWLALFSVSTIFIMFRHFSTFSDAAIGLTFGTLGGVLSTLWIASGLEALGATPLAAYLGCLGIAVWGAGVPWAALGLAKGVARRLSPGPTVLVTGVSLFAIDTLRSIPSVGLPWVLLGHSQGTVPGVAQLAAVGGVPLVSALVGSLAAAIAMLIAPRDREEARSALRWTAALAGGYFALVAVGLPIVTAARGSLTSSAAGAALELLLVQPNRAPAERWAPAAQRTNLALLAQQTERALAEGSRHPDLVLWPETSLTTPLDRDPALREELLAHVDRLGVPVMLGVVRAASNSADPSLYHNSVLWVEPGRGIVDAFDKTHAVPLVEAAPWRNAAGLLGLAGQRRFVEAGREQRPLHGSRELAVLLCYEALFPNLVAARRTPQTLALVNLANDSWFLAEAPSRQQVAFASFRAIEERLPLVRVAHGGISAVIDPYGRIRASLPFAASGVLRTTVQTSPPPSVAERAALLALLGFGGALGFGAAALLTRRRLS
jgi:apolipoprotein N-acyltransferase